MKVASITDTVTTHGFRRVGELPRHELPSIGDSPPNFTMAETLGGCRDEHHSGYE